MNTWHEGPIEKLGWKAQLSKKEAFGANYNGEVLDEDSTPGVKPWRVFFAMTKPDNALKWLPWKSYRSERQEAELLKKMGNDNPRAELARSFVWLYEESLELEHMIQAKWQVEQILTVRRNIIALCGTAALQTLKKSDNRLLFFFAKQKATSGMRLPTAEEAEEADERV